MAKKSQRDIVAEKLESEGSITNVWAFNNYILRLGAIIHGLRKEGWNILTEMKGVNHNQAEYTLISKPRKSLFKI